MNKDEKVKLLKMGISCLRKKGEKRPIFSSEVPTEEEIDVIKNSLETGEVDEVLLKKFFPMAYGGVSKYGFFKYFFYVHNKIIRMLEKYTKDKKLVEWCTAYPAEIISEADSNYIIKTIDDKKVITNSEAYPGIKIEKELKVGDLVVFHRDKISMILNQKEFETSLRFYNKFKREEN